ncbi:glycoprotein A33 (transmembrane), paralog a [Tachysurus ichikawai]
MVLKSYTYSIAVDISLTSYEFARGLQTPDTRQPINHDHIIQIILMILMRADLQLDIPKGSAVLTLKSVTSKENRLFECIVRIPGDKQGKTSDTTSLVILVAPTKPICAIQGKVEYYQNINLTCRSEEGTPTPTYKFPG